MTQRRAEHVPDVRLRMVPLQLLVTAATVVAVIFVVLLSLPKAGGPVALPALGILWGTCSGLALLLHAELPVSADRANSRLFPDSKVQVRSGARARARSLHLRTLCCRMRYLLLVHTVPCSWQFSTGTEDCTCLADIKTAGNVYLNGPCRFALSG